MTCRGSLYAALSRLGEALDALIELREIDRTSYLPAEDLPVLITYFSVSSGGSSQPSGG